MDVRPIRVLIADDQALVRAGFHALLARADDIEVVGEAADGLDAVAQAARLRPDVVLMDVRMPHQDGIAATARIVADPALADTKVVVVTTFELDEYIHRALRAGASGFLLKDLDGDELRRAVRVVAAGEALLAPSVTRRLIGAFTRRGGGALPPELARGSAVLTDREREVVALVGRGLSNEEIAAELVISPATAKTHVSHAMTKLAARDRAQLVVFAYETGLV
ncbi:response regulator transcription factor [Streptacidiphilus fuscans]|uniref:Response regulator transcription factor n=1 Tax=Streptacidiphilus fuscans TaxID=2789292 RepID=A0A931BAI6_9ACTN|nr:response regulator transcription factor [Streptacidiphilus fuscans]MBF9073614.1 response regulator transcription factor [Streptacidiphilus fuscans]